MTLRQLGISVLEDLSVLRANKLIDRLQESATQPAGYASSIGAGLPRWVRS
jgi:hypothetical protein